MSRSLTRLGDRPTISGDVHELSLLTRSRVVFPLPFIARYAVTLYIPEGTVTVQLDRIMGKLNVRNRTEAEIGPR